METNYNPFDAINQRLDAMLQLIKQQQDTEKKPNRVLTGREVDDLLNISPRTRKNWVDKGYLIQHGIGKRVYYLEEEVITCLKKRRGGGK